VYRLGPCVRQLECSACCNDCLAYSSMPRSRVSRLSASSTCTACAMCGKVRGSPLGKNPRWGAPDRREGCLPRVLPGARSAQVRTQRTSSARTQRRVRECSARAGRASENALDVGRQRPGFRSAQQRSTPVPAFWGPQPPHRMGCRGVGAPSHRLSAPISPLSAPSPSAPSAVLPSSLEPAVRP
jgi:hypothetical protein